MKKIIIVSSIILSFSLIMSAVLFGGDQDKNKAKTTAAVQKVEGQEAKTGTDKCGHCEHQCQVKKAEVNSNEKCDCENCGLTKGSPECKAKHAAGECKHECKHDAGKTDQTNKEKK